MLKTINIVVLFLLFSLSIFAQNLPKNPEKKGKIDDLPIKDKNDKIFDDLMFKGRFYMGKSFDDDSKKNYSQALKFFRKANELNKDSAFIEIYKIYIGGGYGEKQDLPEADAYFAWGCAKNKALKLLDDQQDIDFCNIQTLQKNALNGDQEAMANLAMHFFELDFSQHLINYWLEQANSNANAIFLKDRYALIKQRFLGKDSLNMFSQNWAEITEKHANLGSEMAKMAWVSLKSEKNENVDAKNLLASFLKNTFSEGAEINLQDELRLKALILLAKTSSKTEKLIAQTQIFEAITQKNNFKKYVFANDIFAESEKINAEIGSISGLNKIANRYQTDLMLNIADYDSAYGGNLSKFVSLYNNLTKPEHLSWIGNKNLELYKTEINAKILENIRQKQTLNEVLSSFSNLSQADLPKKLLLGADLENYYIFLDEKISFSLKNSNSLEKLEADYKKIINLPELKDFLQSRMENYKNLVLNSVTAFIDPINDLESILRIKKEFEIDAVKKEMYPNYAEFFAQKINALGLEEMDIFIATQKIEVEYWVLNNLPFLKNYLDNLDKNAILTDLNKKKMLLSFVKKAGINSLYGKNAPAENQLKLKPDALANKWLEPEATEMGLWMGLDIFSSKVSTPTKSMEQGKIWYENVMTNPYFPKNTKDSLAAIIKTKTIESVYSYDYCGENLAKINQNLTEMLWLLPEGRDFYWHIKDHCDSITIKEHHFKYLAEGKPFYDLFNDPNRPEKSRWKTIKRLRRKVVHDSFDHNPTKANLDLIKDSTEAKNPFHVWLKTEGNDSYLKIYNDCDWHISRNIDNADHSELYRYEVTQTPNNIEVYDLVIYEVNLKDHGDRRTVYSSQMTVKEIDHAYVVQIGYSFRKQEGSAMWQSAKENYFQGIYAQNSSALVPSKKGGLFDNLPLNEQHGFSEEYLTQKEDSGAFKIKSAIKTSLKYFIFKHKSALALSK